MKRAVEAFLRVVTRRCEGPLSVVSDEPEVWSGTGADLIAPESLERVEPPGSLILALDLSPLSAGERAELVARAWERLRPGAALVLLTPNPEAADDRESVPARREVKRLLRTCGRVHKWKDQPFRWLAFETVKRREGLDDIDEEELARYEVTAELCRGRVLELGCGRGDLGGLLLARGHAVTGCDLAARKVAEAARRHPQGTFLHSDIMALELEGELFETVLLPEVLEHVEGAEGQRLLDKAWSFTAPGGRLVVTVPNENNIPHANHLRVFDRASLEEQLAPYGQAVFSRDQPYKWLMAHVDRSK